MNENSLRYEGWRVAGASAVGVFFSTICFVTFNVLLKPLAEEFSWSRAAVSSAYAAMTLSAAVCAPAIGYLTDRIRPRLVGAMGLAIAGCAFASLSMLTHRLWHLYVVYAALGAVATASSGLVYARAVVGWFDSRRGTALGLAMSGASIGTIVHPIVAQVLVNELEWRTFCLVSGAAITMIGVPLVTRFVSIHEGTPRVASAHGDGATVSVALRSRVFWILFAVVFGGTVALNGVIVHLSALLTDRGVTAADAAAAFATLGAGSVAGRLLTGWLLDHVPAPRVLFALLSVAACGTILLSGAQSIETAVVAVVLIGFGTGGEVDVIPYMLSRYFGVRTVSTLFGLVWAAWGIAGAAGPMLMGHVYDLTASYELALRGLALSTLVAGSLILAVPPIDAAARASASRRM